MVSPNGEIQTFEDFVRIATEREVTIGLGGGAGSSDHLAYAMIKEQLGLNLTAVPFDSAAEAVAAVMGGHVEACIGSISSSSQSIIDGNVTAIAITAGVRSDILPDVPTLTELGYPEIVVEFHIGAFGPPNMSADQVKILSDAMAEAVERQEFKDLTTNAGIPAGEFYDTERWAAYVLEQDTAMQNAAELLNNNPI